MPLAVMRAAAFCFALCLAAPLWAWEGRVLAVHDGDTLLVQGPGQERVRVVLYGIAAPEGYQDFGAQAADDLARIALGREVAVEPVSRSEDGSVQARVELRGEDISESRVRAGLAWVRPGMCSDPVCSRWVALEAQARRGRKGLWAAVAPIPPWEWKRGREIPAATGREQDSGPARVTGQGDMAIEVRVH